MMGVRKMAVWPHPNKIKNSCPDEGAAHMRIIEHRPNQESSKLKLSAAHPAHITSLPPRRPGMIPRLQSPITGRHLRGQTNA